MIAVTRGRVTHHTLILRQIGLLSTRGTAENSLTGYQYCPFPIRYCRTRTSDANHSTLQPKRFNIAKDLGILLAVAVDKQFEWSLKNETQPQDAYNRNRAGGFS